MGEILPRRMVARAMRGFTAKSIDELRTTSNGFTRRKLLPGPDGVRVLALGSVIDGESERPEGLR